MLHITLYLNAIILANLSSVYFGTNASIINAFLFIGLDLTSRDKLHDAWDNNGLIWKMATLITFGSLITYIFNRNAGQIAIASFSAFALASIVDTWIYQCLQKRSYLIKVNGSNILSALVDSMVFPTIAFGGFLPLITLAQFVAKVSGGEFWVYILKKHTLTLKDIYTLISLATKKKYDS